MRGREIGLVRRNARPLNNRYVVRVAIAEDISPTSRFFGRVIPRPTGVLLSRGYPGRMSSSVDYFTTLIILWSASDHRETARPHENYVGRTTACERTGKRRRPRKFTSVARGGWV